MKLSSFLSRGVLAAAVAWGLAGCGDSSRPPGAGGGLDKTPIPGKCSTPAEGCPCTTDLAVECGETVERDENTLTCRKGERTCIDGSWSSCAGTKTTQIYAPPPTPPGVGIQALAAGAESCEDECDPYCQTLADTPDESVMVGDGLTVDDDGIELVKGANCTDIAIDPAMSTLVITQINDDGTVVPDTVSLEPDCLMGMLNIDPSWSVMETDRAAINQEGDVRVFSAIASTLHVTAQTQTDSGDATVDVKVDVNDLTALPPATAAATAAAFAMPGTAADPGKTLYPYKDTVFPLDLHAPVVQWQTGGTNATQVQVALRYPRLSTGMPITFSYSKIHASEPTSGPLETAGAPAWQIPQAVWNAFGRSAAGQVGELVIQRRTATTLYNEMIIPVQFATEPLRGTVYYTQYKRRLRDTNAATNICGSQPDVPDTYNALSPGGTICPVGNCTHIEDSGASTTRAIDMSDSAATNLDPFGGNGGCPVCHSVSANGNVYVAGSRFLAKAYSGTNAGFVNDITANADGVATFSLRGEAPNYAQLRNVTDWDSRGFGYAPLTPNGELALQGFYTWGNTADGTVGDNLQLARPRLDGGQLTPMFFVPTDNIGSTVQYATTAPLNPASTTLTGNVLTTTTTTQTLKSVDGVCLTPGNTVLLKNEAIAKHNGVYTLNSLGGCKFTSPTTPTSVSSTTGGNNQAYAVDGNPGTRWESAQGVDPQSIFVNLTAVKQIKRVRIDWENASARDYLVQVSNTGTTWTTVANMTNMATGDHRIDTHCLDTTGQYVRLWMTARTTVYGYSIYEIEVSGDDAACSAPFTPSSYQLTRRVDADDAPGDAASNTDLGTITGNYEVRVTRGNANYGHVFRLGSATAPAVNTDPLPFADTGATPITWPMMTPTISPDGTKLAYVTGDQDVIGADSTAWRKGITVTDLNIANRTVTNKKRVLNNWNAMTGGNSVKWPFFEGDSRSLIFVESNTSNFCSHTDPAHSGSPNIGRACNDSIYGNMAPTSRGYWPGRLTSIDAGAANPAATKFELSKANDAEDAADADKAYQPTVLKDAIGGYRWVIFTSPRSYGNQINQVGTHFTCGATMLWVAAVDDATATATDRSHPAFLLPGQTMAQIVNPEHYVNERGYLVPSPCKGDGVECSSNSECCNDNCAVDSVPMSGPPTRVCRAANYCAAMGGACLSASDCCGVGACVDQKCVPPPVYDSPATYTREYEAECPAGFHPLWGLFLFHQTSEGNSHIGYSAKTALTQADLDMAESVALLDSTADNLGMPPATVNVGDRLLAATPPVSANLSWLRLSMTLYPSGGGAYSPILHDWEQRYTCVPAE